MSIEAVGWAMNQQLVTSPTDRFVLLALANYADPNGERIFPSVPTIARQTGYDDRTVQRVRKRLLDSGVIEEVEGPRSVRQFRIPALSTPGAAPPGAESPPRRSTPGTESPPPGTAPPPPGTAPPNPLVNHQEKGQEEERGLRPPKKRRPVDDVWAHYVAVMRPRRVELDRESRSIITAALRVASAQECKDAIDGCAASDWHMGRDPRTGGKKYNALSQILKGKRPSERGPGRTTREQIDLFLDVAAGSGAGTGATSADAARVRSAKREVLDAAEFPGDPVVVRRGEEAAAWLAQHGIVRKGDAWVHEA